MATFLPNEVNATGGDITGRTAHVQIMFLKDKKCRVFEDMFSMTQMNKQIKESPTLCDITRCIEK